MMRLMVTALGLMIPMLASAQHPSGMDPAQMQEMMKKFQDPAAMAELQAKAEAASRCMEGIDQSQLEALQARAESASQEIETLCKAGQKDEALQKGLALAKELQSNKTVMKLRECSKDLGDMMKDMPWAQVEGMKDLENQDAPTADDICS